MQIIRYPNCDKPTGHKRCLKVGAIVALFIALEFLILGTGLGAAEKPVKVAADKLMAEYQKNEIAADTRYKGKMLAVTGIVINVGKGIGDTAYVALVTGDIIFKIQCFFEKQDDAVLAQLGSGVQVTIIGWCEGKIKEGNVVLKKCALKAQLGKKQEAVVGYYTLGNTYHGLGNYQQALEDFDRAIELDPTFAEAYWGRGKTYRELGNNPQAIKDFDRAIELEPKFSETYWDRGKIYNELGNHQQAIEDWKMAAKLGHEGAQDTLRSKEIKW
jgi:tetratricopeptide (TPR) repeat protein